MKIKNMRKLCLKYVKICEKYVKTCETNVKTCENEKKKKVGNKWGET